jgi:hypothetical protein
MYQYAGTYSPFDTVTLRPIVSSWNAAGLNWDSRPAVGASAASGLVMDSGINVWRNWDGLETLVQAWRAGDNYGLMLENNRDAQQEELYSRFYSVDYADITKRPYMEVTLADAPVVDPPGGQVTPEPVSIALFLLGASTLGLRCARQKNI